jgi:hypothetical protein
MILRRILVERYGCFGTAEFEFRRGMNLVSGSNDSGKSLLLKALPAVLFGVAHGTRLRSWGDSLSCRGTLLFEAGERQIRMQRDLENNLVRLEECGADGKWRELFSGAVPPDGSSPARAQYFAHLQRLFGVGGEVLLRGLLDCTARQVLCDADGCLAGELFDSAEAPIAPASAEVDPQRRREQLAALEAEVAADYDEYRRGEEYLAWIRRRWQQQGEAASAKKKAGAGKPAGKEASAQEQERDELARQLRKQGVPLRLPADLDELFVTAEGLRQELAALQQELTPLQRSKQGVVQPGGVWPWLSTLAAIAMPAVAFWFKVEWLLAAAVGGAVLLVTVWSIYLVRRRKARAILHGLEDELHKVEAKRADALARQEGLAERFAAFDLPSTPVEMVKLQQLCARHATTLDRYRTLCAQLGGGAAPAQVDAGDRHLRPEELPDAEAKLAELGESLRRREARLQALRAGAPLTAVTAALPVDTEQRQKLLLQGVAQQLERLTGGRYREVRLEEGRLRLEAAPGRWAAPAECGRGTSETLLLALRMTLVQLTGARLPLPVDDLPACLDLRRRQSVLRALERFAAEQQLLLTSSDEELPKRAARERWQLIDLNPPAGAGPAHDDEESHAGQLHLL